MSMPRVLQPLLTLAQELRVAGFAVAPDQTIGLIEAVGLLGPRDVNDIRRAALALFAIPPEGWDAFDRIFRKVFWGHALDSDELLPETQDPGSDMANAPLAQPEVAQQDPDTGAQATHSKRAGQREFAGFPDDLALKEFARLAPARLPRRASFRRVPSHAGKRIDLRRTIRGAARNDMEVLKLIWSRRKLRQRRVLLLIDVSGSMKAQTQSALRFAHTLSRVAEHCEVFTLGTTLTRITREIGIPDEALALARAGRLISDIDGGTRLGEVMQQFLRQPRHAGFARAAFTLVLSDGLERGEPDELRKTVAQLSRLAWRLDWLSPLVTDSGISPQTASLQAILPYLNTLSDGSTIGAICRHILGPHTAFSKAELGHLAGWRDGRTNKPNHAMNHL